MEECFTKSFGKCFKSLFTINYLEVYYEIEKIPEYMKYNVQRKIEYSRSSTEVAYISQK